MGLGLDSIFGTLRKLELPIIMLTVTDRIRSEYNFIFMFIYLNAILRRLNMFQPFHLASQKPSCKVPSDGEEEEIYRRRGGKTTSNSGQGWS